MACGAALAVLSVAVVIYPFLKSRLRTRAGDSPKGGGSTAPDLEPIYDSIRTLHLEYQLGQVPDNLYREQLRGYRLQAANVLRRRDHDRAGAPGWLLEQEVLLARATMRAIDGPAGKPPRLCPNCRTLPGPDMTVCPECGARLDRLAQRP